MTRTSFGSLLLLLVSVCVFAPASARADINYEFIKLNCNSDIGMAVITSVLVSGDSRAPRADHPRKDAYYLRDLANSHRKLKCDLGNKQVIFIDGLYSDAHPRDDGFGISTSENPDDGAAYYQWVSYRDPIVIVRNLVMPKALEITACERNEPSMERECSITKAPYRSKSEQ